MTDNSPTVHILPDATSVRAHRGELLAEALARAGAPLSLYCQKRGVCGKCAVRIINGPLPLLEDLEKALLERRGLGADYRLACQYIISGDATIEIPPGSRLEKIPVLETGISTPVALDPQVKKLVVALERPALLSPSAITESLEELLGIPGLTYPLRVLGRLAIGQESVRRLVTAVLYGEREVLDIEPDDTSGQAFGLAIDIGTSTVVVELVDLVTGTSLDRVSAMNSQVSYGADVVSRITHAFQNPDNLNRLKNAIVRQLDDHVAELVTRNSIRRDQIYEAVIAGNAAMNHFLCGIAVDSLALSPFHAVFSTLPPILAAEIGLALHPSGRVFIVPNIKSFVGGDITAGLVASELAAREGNELFIDLGTNGEIVLKKGRQFVATSTAAGPAFEGMSISCGMLAIPGAVNRVGWKNGGFELETIGNQSPQGVCGTGLIDILALSLAHGLISRDGKITDPEKKIRLTETLFLNQQDVREFQLAAAAIKTGIRMMLREFRVSLKNLEAVYVAGAFGSSLNILNSQAIGLLPDIPEPKIFFVGNSSLAGARKILLSGPERAAAESLVKKIAHISLATGPDFQDTFVRSLAFGPDAGGGE